MIHDLKTINMARSHTNVANKTQLQAIHRIYNLSPDAVNLLCGLQKHSYIAKRNLAVPSAKYTKKDAVALLKSIKLLRQHYPAARDDMHTHGCIISYSKSSWLSRTGVATRFKDNELSLYKVFLHLFLIDERDLLDPEESVLISTKELASILKCAEDKVTTLLGLFPGTEDGENSAF